jgi:autotransporter-associated beta strand protein
MNTYTGTTTIQKGTLSINSISNVNGGASSLGSPTTVAAGTIHIGTTTTTGTLLYTGSGHSTDRVVNLVGSTGGGTLDASGSGALEFTTAFTATVVGSKTLTLTGNNTADNRIGGAIVNNTTTGSTATTAASTASTALVLASVDGLTVGNAISGTGIPALTTISAIDTATKTVTLSAAATVANLATITSAGLVNITSLTKAGTGKWILSGTNTYTGATTVSAGTLLVSGGGLTATTGLAVSGGMLQLGASNVLNDAALTLSSGTLSTGATTGFNETLGTLDLNTAASLTLALGTGVHSLQFADSHLIDWSGSTLTITGWTGLAGASGTAGKIFFGNSAAGLTSGQLSQINFSGYSNGATILSTGEIVAVPEPSTWALLAFSLTTVIVLRRRRNS